MARQVKASDFATAYEYEQAKKQARKADTNKRNSPVNRRNMVAKNSDE